MKPDMIPINKPLIGEEEIQLVVDVLKSGFLTSRGPSGSMVGKFEEEFARYVGARHAVAANSGTAALHMALLAAGVGPGDEVLIPSFTFVATAEAVVLSGAKPVFVDIEPETYCMDPQLLEKMITDRAKAVIPVDLYGLPADLKPIFEVAHEHGLVVVEDAAQAHGAEYFGRRIGSVSDLTCFSFYASKNMTTGEGGMVTTDVDEYAEKLRLIRSHGERGDYNSVMLGHNYRMTEISAAIGIAQLRKLPKFLEVRRGNAESLTAMIRDLNGVKVPFEPGGRRHSWYLYTVRLLNADSKVRDAVVAGLRRRGVGATVYYPTPIHLMPYYRRFATSRLPETEKASEQVLSLPVHPGVGAEQVRYIAEAFTQALEDAGF